MTYDGRIEARITIPSGGAAVSATNNNGGPTTCTVPAGNYYLTAAGGVSGLCAALQTQLNTSRPDGWTVTLSTGASGTGKVTIDCSVEPYALSWTSTTLRDMLGFSGNIASTSSASTGAYQARGLWIPDCPPVSTMPYHASAGIRSDRRSVIGPTGIVTSHTGNTMYVHPGWRYPLVAKARTWRGAETTTNASWQKFLSDVARAEGLTWFDGSALVQVYDIAGALVGINENSGAGLAGWYLIGKGVNDFTPMPAEGSPQWSGLWQIDGFDLVSNG
jgi:hypothetical protein